MKVTVGEATATTAKLPRGFIADTVIETVIEVPPDEQAVAPDEYATETPFEFIVVNAYINKIKHIKSTVNNFMQRITKLPPNQHQEY